ncbi:hypothetical protein HD806DRAFT_473891 [Xylariaceae sp. AK1471]|nr:hypothetical protein HD806DRAFT_473891 [Xylariaceae sp. AK1471]
MTPFTKPPSDGCWYTLHRNIALVLQHAQLRMWILCAMDYSPFLEPSPTNPLDLILQTHVPCRDILHFLSESPL